MSCIQEKIIGEIQDSIEAKQKVLDNSEILKTLELMADQITETLKKGGKILLCGNGGSASDALHFAGEIVGRFQKERKAYNAIALNADVATMTAIANDYGYDQVFSRQVEGLMTDKDVLIGISTSGNSKNIIKAVEKAHEIDPFPCASFFPAGRNIHGCAVRRSLPPVPGTGGQSSVLPPGFLRPHRHKRDAWQSGNG